MSAAGVAINHANNMGNTPLHIAAMSGSEEVAVLLAESGGFLGIANRTGFTRKWHAIEIFD